MKLKILFGLIVTSLLCYSATTDKLKTDERGYLFKGLKEQNTTISQKKTSQALLKELIKIAKEQLEVQKKILKEVSLIRKPAPEKIIVNGKECIANSTPECFQMPLTPTAQKIPVYKNWLRNPNEKNSLALLQWESKYFNGISKSAHSRDFALTKYGSQALHTSFNRSSFDSIGGGHKTTRIRNKVYLLNKFGEKTFEIYLYFGKNAQLDYQSFHNYVMNIKTLNKINYHVVFYTSGAKEAFYDSSKTFLELDYLLKHAKTVSVNKKLFKEAHIYTTPTFAIKLKKTEKIEPITVGNYFPEGVRARIMKMLVMKGIIKTDNSPDYKIYQRVGTSGVEFVDRFYGKDLNMTMIQKLYKKDGKK